MTWAVAKNELRIPIVGVGTRDADLAIRSDDQLENRFEPIPIPRWKEGDDLLSLLASFEAVLPLRRRSEIATPRNRGDKKRRRNYEHESI